MTFRPRTFNCTMRSSAYDVPPSTKADFAKHYSNISINCISLRYDIDGTERF